MSQPSHTVVLHCYQLSGFELAEKLNFNDVGQIKDFGRIKARYVHHMYT